jgi:tape measure domain-containing protein
VREAFSIFGTIVLRGGELVNRQLENVNNRLRQTERQARETGEASTFLGGKLKMLGGMAGAAALAAGVSIAKMGLAYNANLETSTLQWKTLLGSQEKAQKQMKNIAALAKRTQFDTKSVNMMAVYLHNAGVAGEKLNEEITKVADIGGAFNLTADSALELTRQMSQVRQAGVAYTEDLNVLQDRGVPIYGAIAKQLNINVAAVKKMASEGKLTSDIYLKAFDSIAQSVKGSSDEMSQTMTGIMSTLGDNASELAGHLTEDIFPSIKEGITRLNGEMQLLNQEAEDGSVNWQHYGDAVAETNPFLSHMIDNLHAITSGFRDIGREIGITDGAIEKVKGWGKSFYNWLGIDNADRKREAERFNEVYASQRAKGTWTGPAGRGNLEHAKGGYFDGPTAMNIAGEAGREVLIPLQNRKYMAPFAKAVAENMQNADSGGYSGSLEIPVMMNDKELVRAIIPNLDLELARRANRQGSLINRGNL